MVAASATLLWLGIAQAATTPEQKCQQSKLKAQGKLKTCLAKSAAGVIVGKADTSAECQTKFAAALSKADTKAADAGTSCRYMADADTVSDLNTGLMWEKKTASGIHDVNARYTWSSSDTPPNGTAFTGLLGALNFGTSNNGTAVVTSCFAGHCDWRLPTIQELNGIVDPTAAGCALGSPCIDPAFGPVALLAGYWSATTTLDSDFALGHGAWIHFFSHESALYSTNKTTLIAARAVRGGL